MIELNIPGRGFIQLAHLVCDVNGTLAIDGQLIEGLPKMLTGLRDRLEIHLLTANTHGQQDMIDMKLNLNTKIIDQGNEPEQKAAYVRSLNSDHVIAIGQGANDASMLESAAIGICVLSCEGSSKEALLAADLIVPDIITALELLEKPLRLVATLRK